MVANTCKYEEPAVPHPITDMAARQLPLQTLYRSAPDEAWITDRAATRSKRFAAAQPLYGEVTLDGGRPTDLTFGVHKAVGGEGDYPVPGELLCAAVATCLDSTIRIIANRMHIALSELVVQVEAQVDVRGTLLVDPKVPVGFQQIKVGVQIGTPGNINPRIIEKLLRAAEHSCVVLQTLRKGTEISVERLGA